MRYIDDHSVILKALFLLIFESINYPQTEAGPFGLFSLKTDKKYPLRSIETVYYNYKNGPEGSLNPPQNDKNGLFMSEKQLRDEIFVF